MRELFPGQDQHDPHENTQDKADDETKAGGIFRRSVGEIKNARRLILMHALENTRDPIISTAIDPARQRTEAMRGAGHVYFSFGQKLVKPFSALTIFPRGAKGCLSLGSPPDRSPEP